MLKYIKEGLLLWLLLFTGILFTIIGIVGKNTIYAGQSYDPVKMPVLSVMFSALNEEIYPWQLFDEKVQETASIKGNAELKNETDQNAAWQTKGQQADSQQTDEQLTKGQQIDGQQTEKAQAEMPGEGEDPGNIPAAKDPSQTAEPTPIAAVEPTMDPDALASPTPLQRLEPIRETTYEEYLNHISVDIYGDAGVLRAAEYEFVPVDISWFDDALFIGDSRTVGLRDYTDLSEHADFYCETSLTIYKVLDEKFAGKGTVRQALENKDYAKIYIMVGINELGTGTTEDYMAKYTEVIDTIRELEPQALIFIQGVMRVTDERSNQGDIFNNDNINARNHAVATLADNQQIFYIDVNEVVCDETGGLNAEYTHDKIHLLGMYNELWKEFLMTRGVETK